jgi:hypothetical protein
MKLKSSLVLALIAFASVANGAIYIFNNVVNGIGDTLYANSANALSSDSIVSVGYFTSGFDLNANINNQALLLANYTILSSVTTGSTSPSLDPSLVLPLTTLYPGYTEYEPIDTAAITGLDTRIGLTLYSFNGNASTLGTSNEFSLFEVDTIADDDPTEKEYTINPLGLTPLIGTLGIYNGDAGGGEGEYNTLKTAAIIPEPSAALLGSLGVLVLLRRRRN